jgi:undecaprenyl-diphosphatase
VLRADVRFEFGCFWTSRIGLGTEGKEALMGHLSFICDRRYLNQLRAIAMLFFVVVGVMYVAMAVPATRSWIQSIDDQVLALAANAEADPLVSIAEMLSFIGGSVIMFPFVMIVAAYLYVKKHKIATLLWLLGMALAEILIWASKFIYARPRPPNALVTTHGYSFPSGHAGTAAAVAAGIVLLLVARGSRHWYHQALAVVYVVAVAWSRVYLRAHWLSDVFTGAALGAAVAISVILVVSIVSRNSAPLVRDDPALAP